MTKNALGLPFIWHRISRIPKKRDPLKAANTVAVLFRVSPQMKRALDQAAADDHRTLASCLRKITTDRLEADGYLK